MILEPATPAQLDAIRLDALFVRSARGELLATRDPSPRPAPRSFLVRSAARSAWAVHDALDPATKLELARLLAAEPPRAATEAPATLPRCRARVLDLLHPAASEHHGPAYVLGDDLPHDDRARLVPSSERSRWSDAFPWLAGEFASVAPVAIAFEAGRPAAICHSPRGVTAVAAEAGVETLERFRGRGLATAAVACWAREIRRRGRLALYSTSWDNEASRALARRLSARLYADDWSVA